MRVTVLRQFRSGMASDRRLGCLSIFLFIALCASLFVNFVLMIAAFQRVSGVREAEPIARFREILLQRGARATTDKIAVITMFICICSARKAFGAGHTDRRSMFLSIYERNLPLLG